MCAGNHPLVRIAPADAARAVLRHSQSERPVATTDIER
jgi:hypothetical protein